MLKKEASAIVGGLSRPGKMPGPSYNLPASMCQTGQKLVRVPGTVCHGCYALKGRYRFPNVQAALKRRLRSLDHGSWTTAMVRLITGVKHFRWHDSGDLQSAQHLTNIFEVCNRTPETMHWLPTREAKLLQYLDPEVIPKNLVVRVSGTKVNGPAPSWWPWTSTVTTIRYTLKKLLYFFFRIKPILKDGSWLCPSQLPLGLAKCRSCRACWTRSVKNVTYSEH